MRKETKNFGDSELLQSRENHGSGKLRGMLEDEAEYAELPKDIEVF